MCIAYSLWISITAQQSTLKPRLRIHFHSHMEGRVGMSVSLYLLLPVTVFDGHYTLVKCANHSALFDSCTVPGIYNLF